MRDQTAQRGPIVLLGILLFFSFVPWATAGPDTDNPVSIAWPSELAAFQPGPGREIAAGYCVICHSADYIYMQPPHPQEKWEAIVRKMQEAFGCPVPDDQVPALVAYLVSQNAIQPARHAPQRAASPSAPSRAEDAGKAVYESHCRVCHGPTGKGDGPAGQRLVPPAADLTITNKSDAELLQIIRKGKLGTAMPAWAGTLSDQEIQALLRYIRALGRK